MKSVIGNERNKGIQSRGYIQSHQGHKSRQDYQSDERHQGHESNQDNQSYESHQSNQDNQGCESCAESRVMVCLLCPRGCRLQVTAGQDGKLCVSGNSCPRGIGFAGQEWERPMRSLSSTVKTRSPVMPVLPVRVSAEIPLERVFEVMREINRFVLKRPVNMGEVLIENVCALGVNVIATAPLTAEALPKDEEDTETEARLNAAQRGKFEIQARREAGPGGKI